MKMNLCRRVGTFALSICLVAGLPSRASAQEDGDAELNAAYRALASALPAAPREQLRRAERAWIRFKESNHAAFREAAGRIGAAPVQVGRAQADENLARREQLGELLASRSPRSPALAALLDQADKRLNAVYRRCLVALGPGDGQRLRETQRAWIEFRDEHAASARMIISPGADAALAAMLIVTNRRARQLEEFYLGAPSAGTRELASPPAPREPEKADPTIPDPFARVR